MWDGAFPSSVQKTFRIHQKISWSKIFLRTSFYQISSKLLWSGQITYGFKNYRLEISKSSLQKRRLVLPRYWVDFWELQNLQPSWIHLLQKCYKAERTCWYWDSCFKKCHDQYTSQDPDWKKWLTSYCIVKTL